MQHNDEDNGNVNHGRDTRGQQASGGDSTTGPEGGGRYRRRTAGVRAAALRRAREAKQARDARRRQHEMTVEAALADYYAAISYVEDVRARASRRAGRILSEAEESVQGPLDEADTALRRLRDLGETRETIRELTQTSLARLRQALTGEDSSEGFGQDRVQEPATSPGPAGGEGKSPGPAVRVLAPAAGVWHGDRFEGHPVDEDAGVPATPDSSAAVPGSAAGAEPPAWQRSWGQEDDGYRSAS